MTQAIPVYIPLLNPNEPEALLAGLHIHNGQKVNAGELLCTLETTKSAADLLAEASGYIAGMESNPGQTVRAGDILCYIAPVPDWQPETTVSPAGTTARLPTGLRITQPALALAQQHLLDLDRLPRGELITLKHIQHLVSQSLTKPPLELPPTPAGLIPVIIYGGGGHGKALIDLLQVLGGYAIVGIVDDRLPAGEKVMDVPVLGGADILPSLVSLGVVHAVNAVGGIGNLAVRVKVFKILADAGFTCPTLVHPRAFIESSARLSDGVQVFPQAYVGSAANIGYGVIINTGAIVSHDCQIGRYANLSPGAILAGEVQIGEQTLVGMGATINLQVKIGSSARIGNGATVKSDVPAGGIVRAGTIWPPD
jgi:sugar O-acyltransferase (sialic acid O-acetyltransferase NeuD family)